MLTCFVLFRRVLLLSLSLLASQQAAAASLDGRWLGLASGQSVDLQLNHDGSGTLDGEVMKYEAAGGVLMVRLKESGRVVVYGYRLQGDALTLQSADLPGPMTLQRGGPQKTGAEANLHPALLAGTWCLAGGSTCLTLTANGRYSFGSGRSVGSSAEAYGGGTGENADDGQWSATPSQFVVVSDAGARRMYPLFLRNDLQSSEPMICLGEDCYISREHRVSW